MANLRKEKNMRACARRIEDMHVIKNVGCMTKEELRSQQ